MKKQETLEEFIKEILQDEFFTNIAEYKKAERLIEIGAKWQQEQQDNIEKLAKEYENSVVYADKGVVYHAFIEGYNKARNYIVKPELNDLKK
jgi:hypothetical protein